MCTCILLSLWQTRFVFILYLSSYRDVLCRNAQKVLGTTHTFLISSTNYVRACTCMTVYTVCMHALFRKGKLLRTNVNVPWGVCVTSLPVFSQFKRQHRGSLFLSEGFTIPSVLFPPSFSSLLYQSTVQRLLSSQRSSPSFAPKKCQLLCSLGLLERTSAPSS